MIRSSFLAAAVSQLGCPYSYGGRGSPVSHADLAAVNWPFPVLVDQPRLFDCSGLVVWAWRHATGMDWLKTHDCDALMRACRKVSQPRNGTLVLYGKPGDAQHVTIYQDRCVLGANGGDSTTTTLARAAEQGARVCMRPSPTYRPDLLGYFELPWPGA